jgi:hypothetical protein
MILKGSPCAKPATFMSEQPNAQTLRIDEGPYTIFTHPESEEKICRETTGKQIHDIDSENVARIKLPTVRVNRQVNAFEKKMKNFMLIERGESVPLPTIRVPQEKMALCISRKKNVRKQKTTKLQSAGLDSGTATYETPKQQFGKAETNKEATSSIDNDQEEGKVKVKLRNKNKVLQTEPSRQHESQDKCEASGSTHPKFTISASASQQSIERNADKHPKLASANSSNLRKRGQNDGKQWLANFDKNFERAMDKFSTTVINMEGLALAQDVFVTSEWEDNS